jgi:predicted N-acetyltransferase YhbS
MTTEQATTLADRKDQPSTPPLAAQAYRRELGDGLLLRWSTPDDVERIIELYDTAFRPTEDAPPNPYTRAWVRDMMSGRHPRITGRDFALIEDTRRGTIVAATCLLAQRVTYDHIPFMLGRPEVVATDVNYRGRGLQRAIFELIHARSAARGHLAQGITGIPAFYRQFGYEFATHLEATRQVYFSALPPSKEADQVPCALRPATLADVPLLAALYERERACWQIATVLDEAAWRWMALECDPAAGTLGLTYMLTSPVGEPIGQVLLSRVRNGDAVGIWGMSVVEDRSLAEIAPHALHALREIAPALPCRPDDALRPVRFLLEMGPGHALFDALGQELAVPTGDHYAWWVRIPDVPAFVMRIAPVLEQRLARSVLAGHTGEMHIDFYRDGLRLVFADGKLVRAERWQRPQWGQAQAWFPRPIFAQLLLGYRSFADLAYAHLDVRAERAARIMLEALFPARPSYMLPLD